MSLSCCQTASKVHWAVFYAKVFLPTCFFVCTSLLFHPLTAAFVTSSLQVQDPASHWQVLWIPCGSCKERKKSSILLSFPPQWNRSRWPSFPCSFSPGANSVPCLCIYSGQTPWSRNQHMSVPNHLFFVRFSISHYWPLSKLLLVVKHWTWQLCITAIPSLMAVGVPTCNLWGAKKVKRELETMLFSEKAKNWPAVIIAT